jgi:hypothetical protein
MARKQRDSLSEALGDHDLQDLKTLIDSAVAYVVYEVSAESYRKSLSNEADKSRASGGGA